MELDLNEEIKSAVEQFVNSIYPYLESSHFTNRRGETATVADGLYEIAISLNNIAAAIRKEPVPNNVRILTPEPDDD